MSGSWASSPLPLPPAQRPLSSVRTTHHSSSAGSSTDVSVQLLVDAIDITADGEVRTHKGHMDMFERPTLDCMMQPNSIRIVFCQTSDVFMVRPRADMAMRGVPDSSHVECSDCRPGNTSTEGSAASKASGASSLETDVSPLTNVKQHGPSLDVDSLSYSSYDSEGDYTRKHNYNERWKTYQAASGVAYLDLGCFWSPNSSGLLTLGTNMILDERYESREKIWNQMAFRERHTFSFGDDPLAFFTLPSHFIVHWRKDDCLEIECRFFGSKTKCYYRTPLYQQFFRSLTSKLSAARLFGGNPQLGVRLVTLELLDSLLRKWALFLMAIRDNSIWLSHNRISSDTTILLNDRQHITDFARATRDLIEALEATISAVQLYNTSPADQVEALDKIIHENRCIQRDVRNMMKDLEENIEVLLAQTERSVNERQEASLRRLTIVASVFLPLTLACSLLSMTNRVNELGALWWDWLGIVVIIAIVVITAYRVTTFFHNWARKIRTKWNVMPFHDLWQKARRRVLDRAREAGNQTHHLIPSVTRITFATGRYLFAVGVTISFLIGMFVSVPVGAQSLGYTSAAVLGLCLVIVSICRLRHSLRWRSGSLRGGGTAERGSELCTSDATNVELGGTNPAPAKKTEWARRVKYRLLGFPFGYAFRFGFLVAGLFWKVIEKVLMPCLKFFIGDLAAQTVLELANMVAEALGPGTTVKLWGHSGVNRFNQREDGWQLTYFAVHDHPRPGMEYTHRLQLMSKTTRT